MADKLNNMEAGIASADGRAARAIAAGNLGASYALALSSIETTLIGTLNANHALTITNLSAGARVLIDLVQDATGNRTFSIIVNGVTTAISVNTLPAAATAFWLVGISATDYHLYPLGA